MKTANVDNPCGGAGGVVYLSAWRLLFLRVEATPGTDCVFANGLVAPKRIGRATI
jgi:hypothetical protein